MATQIRHLHYQVQDALPPAGYTKRTRSKRWLLPYNTDLTVTERSPSGRLPLRHTLSARRLLLTMRTCLTDTGRTPSGRLPLRCTRSLRRLLLSMRKYYNPWTSGAHPSGRLPLGHTQSMRWLLLSTTWGSTRGSGLCCDSVKSSYLRNPTQTTDLEPQPTAVYIEIYP